MTTQSFLRAYPAMIEKTGPRQLSGRLVPYDSVADVLDELPGGQHDIYREGFRRGAFAPQVTTREKGVINKISLVHRHGPSGLGYLGPFTALREDSDGLYGDVRILPGHEANVEALLEEGIDELSVEFRLPKNEHTLEVDGVRWRVRAHLDQVALEAKGAYSNAQVLQYRKDMDQQEREQQIEEERQRQEKLEGEEAERAETARKEAAERDRLDLLRLEEKVRAETREREAAEAAEVAERRRAFDAMAARLDTEREKQDKLIREYGITKPGHRFGP